MFLNLKAKRKFASLAIDLQRMQALPASCCKNIEREGLKGANHKKISLENKPKTYKTYSQK